MLKRLDWLDVHGEQDGDSSSSDDNDSLSDSSSDEQSSGGDKEDTAAGSKPWHVATSPLAKPAGHVTLPASKTTATAAAAGKVSSPSRRRTAEAVAQHHKKLNRTLVTGTATHHVEPARSSDSAEKPHGSARQDTSDDKERQQQKQLKQRQKAQQQDNGQQHKASEQHFRKAQQLQLEASSDLDSGSNDDDIAEYRREMMLGRVLSSSDAGDGSASDVEGAESGSVGSEGQTELQVQEVERNWAEADLSDTVRGVALRCVACRALLLNAQSYRTHIHSKKHLSAMEKWGDDGDRHFIAFAIDAPGKQSAADDGETHAERLQRLKQQISAENAGLAAQQTQGSNSSKANKSHTTQQQRRKGRDRKQKAQQTSAADNDDAEGPSNKKRSRQGKRQRAAATASAGEAVGYLKKAKVDKHHNASALRRKEKRAAAAAAAAAARK